jgi:hypothetical protein
LDDSTDDDLFLDAVDAIPLDALATIGNEPHVQPGSAAKQIV